MRVAALVAGLLLLTSVPLATAAAPPELPPAPGLPFSPPEEIYRSVQESAEASAGENVVWAAVNSTYDTAPLCRPNASGWQRFVCNQTTGHYGLGQLRFGCKSPRHTPSGLLYDHFRLAATAIDGTGATQSAFLPEPVRGASACDGAFDHVNATASALTPLLPPLDAVPAAMRAVDDALVGVGVFPARS